MMEWQGSSCIVLTVDIEAIGERPASDWFSFALASHGESERKTASIKRRIATHATWVIAPREM